MVHLVHLERLGPFKSCHSVRPELVVLARKLLRLAFSVFKHKTDFDPKLINIA